MPGIHLFAGINRRPQKATAGLWIDTGEKATCKAVFDAIISHIEEIESKISMPVSWGRKDEHRTCSIVVELLGADFMNTEEWETIANFHVRILKELADYAFYPYEEEIKAAQIISSDNRGERSMKEYSEIDYALARILHDSATARCFNLSYQECAQELGMKIERKVNAHFGLSEPLYHVAEMCNDLGLPLLSAIVRYSDTKTTAEKTGEGFYKMACEYHPEYKAMEPIKAWKEELNKVRQCHDWSVLDRFLKDAGV